MLKYQKIIAEAMSLTKDIVTMGVFGRGRAAALLLGLAAGLGGCGWLGPAGDQAEPARPSPVAPTPADVSAAKARWAEEALPALDLSRYGAMRLFFAHEPDAPPLLDDDALCRLGALLMEELDRLAPDRPPLTEKVAPGLDAYDATVIYERGQTEIDAGQSVLPGRPDGQGAAPERTTIRALVLLTDAVGGQSLATFRVESLLPPDALSGTGTESAEAWRQFAQGLAAAVLGRPALAGRPGMIGPADAP